MTTPTTFKQAYQILQNHAEHLESTHELDVDNLVAIVEESVAAYRVCQHRIESVEQALQKVFEQADTTKTDQE